MRKASARKASSLRDLIATLAPLVKELRHLEHDCRGIEAQYNGIPMDADDGVEVLLERCLQDVAQRYVVLVGAPPRTVRSDGTPGATSAEVHDLIDAIRRFADATGAVVGDTEPLALAARVWSDHADIYDELPPRFGVIQGGQRVPAKLRLRPEFRVVKLNSDGTLPERFERMLKDEASA